MECGIDAHCPWNIETPNEAIGTPFGVLGLFEELSLIPLDTGVEFRGVSRWMYRALEHEPGLYRHSVLVSELTAYFAAFLGYSSVEQRCFSRAALLHDIGKVRIPTVILKKPEALTSEETLTIHSHPGIGYNLLRREGETDETLLTIVRDHHERLDGSGYPRGIYGKDISIPVRMVTLCDVFAAITETRPYADRLTWNHALDCMFAKQTRLDMELLTQFAAMVTSRKSIGVASWIYGCRRG